MGRKRTKPKTTSAAASSRSTRSKGIKAEPKEISLETEMFLEDLEKEVKKELAELEKRFQTNIKQMENYCKLECAKLGETVLNMLYHDMSEHSSEQRSSPDSTTKRRSRSCSSVFAVPAVPPERTIPRSESEHTLQNFATPGDQRLPLASQIITPKINQNMPMTVMRRPRQGELAVSMSGSPLLVSTVVHDNIVNVNIPMEDGSVISILPQPGLNRSQLPENMSEHAREQLKTIFSNLKNIL